MKLKPKEPNHSGQENERGRDRDRDRETETEAEAETDRETETEAKIEAERARGSAGGLVGQLLQAGKEHLEQAVRATLASAQTHPEMDMPVQSTDVRRLLEMLMLFCTDVMAPKSMEIN